VDRAHTQAGEQVDRTHTGRGARQADRTHRQRGKWTAHTHTGRGARQAHRTHTGRGASGPHAHAQAAGHGKRTAHTQPGEQVDRTHTGRKAELDLTKRSLLHSSGTSTATACSLPALFPKFIELCTCVTTCELEKK